MQLFQTEYQGLLVHLDFSQEILDFSYPNTNYFSIATQTFLYSISDIKKKAPNKLKKLLEKTKNSIYFICAHSQNTGENKWFFFDAQFNKTKFNLETHLLQRHQELDFESSIINICNSNQILLNPLPFSSLYSKHYIGLSANYDDKKIILQ
ncbi:MAG: hypothetical protein KC589_00935 [Nanoarchaeota archaeon]|nr:hypothetical protein [Nanoarchaeota archaeon]